MKNMDIFTIENWDSPMNIGGFNHEKQMILVL